jgi:protein-L-isoaspartate(D-aspartate) O-methyltransferase
MQNEFKEKREQLVRHLVAQGYLKTSEVIKAFRMVPRHLFVPEKYKNYAYVDEPISIGYGQTISAPHMVAVMTELLKPEKSDKVFEVGTGSGYQAAILSRLVKMVYTIEFDAHLTRFASANLERAGYKNVKVMTGDGSMGYKEQAPYDKIIITCATPEIPKLLVEQLKPEGIIIAPVGSSFSQTLTLGIKKHGKLKEKHYFGCIFVPLRHYS